ncbi:type iv fimbrial assembly protein pilc [hydrocarbon metagenome]|uniref:Type iv fimbrial assembly protein pilc n=1 Tax=hydrocarbon metagenome TaxID=938273 RepID=A0A0W8E8T4_9ZZZZ
MQFSYRARDKRGSEISGQVQALNKREVINGLLKEKYCILEVIEFKGRTALDMSMVKSVGSRDLLLMTRMLATMLDAGLPIIRALNILHQQTNNKHLKNILLSIKKQIERGLTLHEALAHYPHTFSPVYINMVKAGEMGGVLYQVLSKLAEHLEREREIRNKVITASIYPALLLVFTSITVIFILVFVMPTFTGLFESVGADLPLPTKILIAFSGFLRDNLPGLIMAVAGLVYIGKKMGQVPAGRYYLDGLYLKLPLFGRLHSRTLEARFARTTGTLINAGIPILQAMEIVEGALGNTYVLKALVQARENISEGQSIALPLQESGVFEPMLTQMISVGEETGALDEMLSKMSDYYDREVMHTIEQSMAAIEPLLILGIAMLIGGVVLATLLPVFDLVGTTPI